jgi:bacterioferritin-associated ferredoxin
MQQKVRGLNKEFKRKDVSRMRNLISGKADASTNTQIGYSTKQKDYKEGDVWTENKKTWTIKNGIKQTISKLDAIKKEVFIPLCCPKCSKVMKSTLDKDNYKFHKKCHDCVITYENKLKMRGEYDTYKKLLKAKNELTILDEMEVYLLGAVNDTNNGYVSEHGEVERWIGGVNKETITKTITESANKERKKIIKEIDDQKRT